jgi:hypothetical protein
MSNAYVIEAKDELAGIVVRDGRKFRFLSASATFWALEGASYRNPRDAERAAAGMLALRAPGARNARSRRR